MSGGSPRTNSAMRLEVESCVTETDFWLALNFAHRLSKYGTTSGFVSSSTMAVRPPEEEEHPATRPGPAIAAAPSPRAFIIERRSSIGPPAGRLGTPGPRRAEGAAVRWFRRGHGSLSSCTRDSPAIPGPPIGEPASIYWPGGPGPVCSASGCGTVLETFP